jgi:uncharacterized protein (TIGR03435 family)
MKRRPVWRVVRIAVPVAILCFAAADVHRGDAQPQTPSAAPLAFEVASIKLSDPNAMGLPRRIGPDSLTTRDSLKGLIMLAYDVRDYQVAGGPAWAQSEAYDIQAKAGSISSPRQIRSMLQTLLADRFRLRLHRETRTMAGYVMTVDRGGPRLPAPMTEAPPEHGVIQMGAGGIWAYGATMEGLAMGLQFELGLPVLDRTKIEGHYDFKLLFEEGDRELKDEPDSGSGVAALRTPGSVFTALREVGLRLDARKLPIEVSIIDGAERPPEN